MAGRLVRDDRGGAAVMFAASVVGALALLALVIDIGVAYVRKRELQGATDLAALAAAHALDQPAEAARATLVDNRFAGAALVEVTRGRYEPNLAFSPHVRFLPDAQPFNAVRVRAQTESPLFFGRGLARAEGVTLEAAAVAAAVQRAAFSIGSRLVGLNGGLLNRLLSALLGTEVSLSAMDYDALLRTNLDLFRFLDRVATSLSLEAVSYDQILETSLPVGTLVDLMIAEIAAGPVTDASHRALSALEQLDGRIPARLPEVRLGDAIGFGALGGLPSGSGGPRVHAALSAFDMLRTAAQLANARRQVEFELDLAVPGLVGATARLAIGEPMQNSGWVGVGEAGATLHTAQTRLYVDSRLQTTLPVLGSVVVRLPLYLELAQGEATLQDIRCNDGNPVVTVAARSGAVDGWIGDLSNDAFTNFHQLMKPDPATIVQVPLLAITGRAHVPLSAPDPVGLHFTQVEIENLTLKSAYAHGMTGNLVTALVSDLSLGVKVLGLGLSLGDPRPEVRNALETVAAALDPVVDALLAALGARVGEVDVRVSGVDCRGAVLVY